jgi:predicted amidohydrolase
LLTALLLPVTAAGAGSFEGEIVISAYQGPCTGGEIETNLGRINEAIETALERKSNFICFPECYLTGYDGKWAIELSDPHLTGLVKSTESHDMVVLVGLSEKSGDDEIANTEVVIHKGKILGKYSKIMLTGGDRDRLGFARGREMPVFEAHGIRFATIICHDSSFPEPALLARQKGAVLLFSPHYNGIGPKAMDEHRIGVRNNHIGLAALMQMVVVRSNVVSFGPKHLGYGDSFIMSPLGIPLAEAGLFVENVITATINPGMFEQAKMWKDLKEVKPDIRKQVSEIYQEPGPAE